MTTLNELMTSYNSLATAQGKPTRKSFDSKALAEAAIKALTPKEKGALLRLRKAGAVREKGPRGFEFGPVWLAACKSVSGIAVKPANLPKVLDTARVNGVAVTPDMNQLDIVTAIAKVLS